MTSLTWKPLREKGARLSAIFHCFWCAFTSTYWPRHWSPPYWDSRESLFARCFPSAIMHLNWMAIVRLGFDSHFTGAKTKPFWHSLLRITQRAKDRTVFIPKMSWSRFTLVCNNVRVCNRKSPVRVGTQLLFNTATGDFIFVQGGATHS